MKLYALAPLILLLGAALAGCVQEDCDYDGADDGFGVKSINKTNQQYYIYICWTDNGCLERPFNPAEPGGASYSVAPGCEGRGPTWYMRVEIREPKPNHEDIWAPERKGDALVFEGNWTGMQCNEAYVFQYNGPSDVKVFEVDNCDNRKRELERVSP